MELALQEGVFFRFGESNELHCIYLLYFYYMPFPAKVKRCAESLQSRTRYRGQASLCTTSQALRASSPSRGASGETVHFAGTAKASPTRRGGIASAMTERLYEDRAFPLQESPARRIASSIFLPKFMVYLFCGLARPLTPDQQDGMGGKTCCCCRRTCFFKLYADKLEKRRFTQNVQPQKNCGLLWHYR